MNTVWEILYARQMALHYVAPPICEVIFSGSSSPIIVLAEPQIGKVTGLVLGGVGGHTLTWNAFPGALCYNVYFIGGDNIAVPLAQCLTDPIFILPPNGPGEIVVTPITLDGEGPPSDPVPYPTGGTFTLTIMSDPSAGAPFSLGPLDVHGVGSGVTTAVREYNVGQTVFVTAELTHNFAAFSKWQLGGADYSENLTVSVLMNGNYVLTAVYTCEMEGVDVPDNFTISGPTSLGIFQVPPDGSPVLVSGDATSSQYSVIFRGGSIQSLNELDCSPQPEFPGLCAFPPGYVITYDGGVFSFDISSTPEIGTSCVVNQETVEELVPVGRTDLFSHTGGSISLRWTGALEWECGNSCPQWEVIQNSGFMTQPRSWHIRDYEEFILAALPIAKLDMGEEGCTDFTSANYPLETDPNAVEWQGNSNECSLNAYFYDGLIYVAGMDNYITPGPGFDPIKMNGFQGAFNQVVAPENRADIENEFVGFTMDPWPVISPVDRYWFFVIWSPVGPIWAGIKAVGETPIGSYQRIASACPSSAPTCLYLENGPI